MSSQRDRILDGFANVGPTRRPNGVVHHPRRIGGYEDLAFFEACRERKEFIFLSGPPGTGKNSVTEAAFEGEPVDGSTRRRPVGAEYLVCTSSTTEADFVGSYIQDADRRYVWVDGPLTRSLRRNVPFMTDELPLCHTRELAVLYPLMDGRDTLTITARPDMDPIPVPDGWFMVGAGNLDVPGAQFSEALRDRFTHHIEVGTDWALAEYLGVSLKMIEISKDLDTKRRNGELDWSPQLRSALAYRDATNLYGEEFAAAALVRKAPANDRDIICDRFRAYFPNLTPLSMGGHTKP